MITLPVIGDKILVAVSGPRGCRLVRAVVDHVYHTRAYDYRAMFVDRTGNRVFTPDDEGLTWTRGHDETTPEACALLVAASLSR